MLQHISCFLAYVAAVSHYTPSDGPIPSVALQVPGVSQVKLPITRCRAISYTCKCPGILCKYRCDLLGHLIAHNQCLANGHDLAGEVRGELSVQLPIHKELIPQGCVSSFPRSGIDRRILHSEVLVPRLS